MCVVFRRLYSEIVSEIFFFVARQTSHYGRPPDGVSFLIGSGNTHLLSLIGRIFVGATYLLSTGRLWPSSRLATKKKRSSNCINFCQPQYYTRCWHLQCQGHVNERILSSTTFKICDNIHSVVPTDQTYRYVLYNTCNHLSSLVSVLSQLLL